MHKFKADCLVYCYKRKNGDFKSASILHRPSNIRLDKTFPVVQGNKDSYDSNALEELFVQLKQKVEQNEKIRQFLQGQHNKGTTDV